MRELNKVLNMGLFIYVAEYQGQWLALPGWSAAAYPIRARDQWIGWNDNQRRVRLPLVASNARFCLLTDRGQYPNLASRVLALNGARLSQDWQEACGHPILLAESFVDTQLFRGAAYKAAGWKALGQSAGFKPVAGDFYEAHARPKQLYARELVKHAARKLRQRHLPPALRIYERPMTTSCQMPGEQLTSLWQVLRRQVPESRNGKGMRHKQAAVLTITFAFLLSGGQGGHRAVASFAPDLTPRQRAAVNCWFNSRTRTCDPPTENCVYRVLKAVPVLEFQQAIWAWQMARHGARDGSVVVLDGEVCFSLWLVSRLKGQDAVNLERALKFVIQHGSERLPWDFDRMLEKAEKTLQPGEFEYAKALAAPFLDESKVSQLDQFDRWRALEPLNPTAIVKDAVS